MTAHALPLQVIEGSLGWTLGCTRTGESHSRENQGSQDAYAACSGSTAGRPWYVAAVADGHGDQRHDRSAIGSALAVQVAITELIGLHLSFDEGKDRGHFRTAFREDFPRRLNRRWREAVKDDATESDIFVGESELYSRYGTTLLVALVVEHSVLVGQIGDGDVLLVDGSGTVTRPLRASSTGCGIVTESLSSEDARRLWRTASVERAEGGILLLASDGLVHAFLDDGEWFRFAQSIQTLIVEHGSEKVARSLPAWLDHYTKTATGDDITLAVVGFPESQVERQAPRERVAEKRPIPESLEPPGDLADEVAAEARPTGVPQGGPGAG